MRRFLAYLFLVLAPLRAYAYPSHPQTLLVPIQWLYQLEESQKLLYQVERQGPIHIQTAHLGFKASNAAWMGSNRTIYLNISKPRSPGSLLSSIIFELHNALSDAQFRYYDHLARTGKISKKYYIEAIEYLEYLNAQKTAHILRSGVRQGIFPQDALWRLAPSFAQHYQVQMQAGHSDLIGCVYDSLQRLP